ncbi:LysM peptidoglycan-binding domain-containing protein [Promicromonospora sp. NPDC090134]|uniref:LysM peptidoglycan-binding domain-containing protein n=1 Tax=Promicromonospora sp. NPDC090134 TaxID=3364408 RepID=UPI00382F3964
MTTSPTSRRAPQRAHPGVRPTTGDRLRGLAATLGLLLLVIGVPVVLELARHRLLPAGFGWDDLGLVLTSAGSTTLVVLVLGCVTWAAWAYLTLTIVLETVALSGRISVPGPLGLPRGLARRLLTTASLLFAVSIPPALAQTPADAAPSHTETTAPHTTPVGAEASRTPARTSAHTTPDQHERNSSGQGQARPRTVSYTVVEDDSLWSIARDQLGDPMRFTEIKDLNQKVLADRPDFLIPGTVLRLPAPPPDNDAKHGAGSDAGTAIAAAEPAAANEAPRDEIYTVRLGDVLTQIALDELGDAGRYTDIVEASEQTVQPDGDRLTDPDLIRPGWRLTIPTITPAPAKPGTERSAETETAAKDSSTPPAKAEQDRTHEPASSELEPDVDTATDRDRSEQNRSATGPGLAIPVPDGSAAHQGVRGGTRSPDATEQVPHTNPWAGPTNPPGTRSTPAPTGTSEGQAASAPPTPPDQTEDDTAEADQSDLVGPAWLVPGLAGGGVMLAAGLLVVLRRRRATQWRYRRPGHRITPAPSSTVPVERTITTTGQAWVGDIDALDRLLRGLAASHQGSPGGDVPALVGVELTGTDAVVHLAEPTNLPLPWVGSGTRWTAALSEAPAETLTDDVLAPYPLLVTVGMDEAGHVWLLDLERARTVTVTGDRESVDAFGRYITAELLLHPWTENTTLHTLATSWDVTGLADFRHHHDHTDDYDTLACVSEVDTAITTLRDSAGRERDESHALIAAPGIGTTTRSALHTLNANLDTDQDRSGAAVVLLGAAAEPSPVLAEAAIPGLVVDVREGRLRVPALGWDLAAVGLAEHELAASVAIVEVTRAAEEVPTKVTALEPVRLAPVRQAEAEPVLASHTPAAGPLEAVQPRPADQHAPAGPWSLLPAPTADYVEAAATTAQDVETLAPVMAPPPDKKIHDADPSLDQDVAAWFDPDQHRRPRLMLLGPVTATAYGRITEPTARLKALHVETLAYLALHPRGVTSAELAEDFGIVKGRARSLVTGVRAWLGTDPATGRLYVPDATESAAFAASGTPGYQVEGLLVDIDLFQRLQARARARGADGIDDLVTALKIVRGRPFSQTRSKGWTWLFEGDRIDHTMTAAIGDVAHLVHTRAMAEENIDLARWAAQVGKQANPDDETSRLDDITIQYVTGHAELARKRLADEIYDRSDDEWPPPDPPERTREITTRRGMTKEDQGA